MGKRAAIALLLSALSCLAQMPEEMLLANKAGAAAAPSAPAFVGEIQRGLWDGNSANRTVITLAGGIAQGHTALIIVAGDEMAATCTNATDNRGNTYTFILTNGLVGSYPYAILSGYMGTALQAGDYITNWWTSTSYENKSFWLGDASGVASSTPTNISTSAAAYDTVVSAPAATTVANTLCFGVVLIESGSYTYGSSAWTAVGAAHNVTAGIHLYYVQKAFTTTGSKDPGGTLNSTASFAVSWAALK